MHDGFTAYDQYRQCQHSLCNAHILRELNYVIETSKPGWATEMKQLLLDMKAAVSKARETGKKRLAVKQRQEFLGCVYISQRNQTSALTKLKNPK